MTLFKKRRTSWREKSCLKKCVKENLENYFKSCKDTFRIRKQTSNLLSQMKRLCKRLKTKQP